MVGIFWVVLGGAKFNLGGSRFTLGGGGWWWTFLGCGEWW